MELPRSGPRLPERASFGILLLLAAALRAAYLLAYRQEVPFLSFPISDSAYYHAWAMRVASGEGYGPAPFYMAPLYPWLLGWFYRLAGPRPEWIPLVQSLLGIANVAMVYRLGRRWFGVPAAWTGAALLSLHGPMIFLETKILTETLSVSLLLAAMLLAGRALERPDRPLGFAKTGIALGLASLARPNFLALAGIGGAWALGRALRGRPLAPARSLILAGVAFLLTLAPVAIRNAWIGRDRVLISSNGGIVFAQGNHPDADGVSTILPGFTPRIEEQQQQEIRVASEALGREVRPSESSAWWFRQGLRFARDQPLSFASLWGRKVLWTLHGREARDVYNLYQEAELVPLLRLLFVPFPLVLGLALFAAWRRLRSLRDDARLGLLAAASILLALVVFSVSFRYRFPATPLLAPFAGQGLLDLWEEARGRRWRSLAGAALLLGALGSVSAIPYPLPPITAEAPANLGAAWLARGDLDRAIAWSVRALRMNPDLASAHYNLGLALRRAGDRERAVRSLEAAVRLAPGDAAAQNDLAVTLDEMGRTAEAVEHYRAALEARSDGRTAYNLALALHALGRRKEALEALDQALRLGVSPDPRFVEALRGPPERPPGTPP